MTKWVLKCLKCGETKVLDVGYDLNEFGKLYLFCKRCGENTFHQVVKCEDEP